MRWRHFFAMQSSLPYSENVITWRHRLSLNNVVAVPCRIFYLRPVSSTAEPLVAVCLIQSVHLSHLRRFPESLPFFPMTRLFFRPLLWSLLLLPAFASAQSIAPRAVLTADGATIVFNTIDSFFAADVEADEVKPAPGTDGFIQVDDRLMRFTNTPDKELTHGAGTRVLLPKEILQLQFRRDLDEEQTILQRTLPDTKQEYLTTTKGRVVLHWWFAMPSKADRGATQRHYMSTVCNRQVLTVCAPLLIGDTQEKLVQYMKTVMESVRESDDPINVKEYAKELRSDK
jgi:hypothetical protein